MFDTIIIFYTPNKFSVHKLYIFARLPIVNHGNVMFDYYMNNPSEVSRNFASTKIYGEKTHQATSTE